MLGNLSRIIRASLGWPVSRGFREVRPGESMEFYSWKCPIHGRVENHPKGWSKDLNCPQCTKTMIDNSTIYPTRNHQYYVR